MAQTRRIGLIVPAPNVMCETEFPQVLPAGCSLHVARLPKSGAALDPALWKAMNASLDERKAELAGARPEVILYACTAGSFTDETPSPALNGIPVLNASDTLSQGIAAMGARRIFLLTPYPAAVMQQQIRFFRSKGLEVVGSDTFDYAENHMIHHTDSAQVLERLLSNRAAIAGAEAVVVSCTGLPTLDILGLASRMLDRPVLSSNGALLAAGLARLGLPAPAPLDRLAAAMREHAL